MMIITIITKITTNNKKISSKKKASFKIINSANKRYIRKSLSSKRTSPIKVPGRPVVSNCGTPTEKASEFLDFKVFHAKRLVIQSRLWRFY